MIDKYYNFCPIKNALLIEQRNVSFEEVIVAIEEGQVIDVVDHPNQKDYLGQRIFILLINGYTYMVPFVEGKDGEVFLKTIIPSRKAKKKYIK